MNEQNAPKRGGGQSVPNLAVGDDPSRYKCKHIQKQELLHAKTTQNKNITTLTY